MVMPFIYNLHRRKNIRRNLRNHPTRSEQVLWFWLRRRQLNNLKFRRQYGIRQYIVDFFCPELKLAIEIDGQPHDFAGQQDHDVRRQKYLEALGIHLIRFTSQDILENMDGVLNRIAEVARRIRTAPDVSSSTNETTPNPS